MRQRIYKIFLGTLKNLAAFLAGAVSGILIVLLSSSKSLPVLFNDHDIGLGVVALVPILFVYFAIVGFSGGVLGVITYHVTRFFRRKNSKNNKLIA